MTQYYKKLGIYKKTGSFTYDPSKQEVFSYEWWQLLRNVEGVLIFNTYSYSNSAAKRIGELWSLLNHEEVQRIDSEENLRDMTKEDILKSFESKIDELQAKINAPRTRKSTNKRRKEEMIRLAVKRDNLAEKWQMPAKYDELTKYYRVLY